MDNAGDIRISGSGTITGGVYNNISISGGGKWNGDVECASFRVSGGAKGSGDIKASQEIAVSGSFKSQSAVYCGGSVKISGSASCDGELRCEGPVHISGGAACGRLTGGKVQISGSIRCESVRAESLSISGGCDIEGDCEAEKAEISGATNIKGLLNADEVIIHSGGKHCYSNIGSIGGRTVTIDNCSPQVNLLFGFITVITGTPSCTVVTESIEADEIDIMSTKAEVIRGNNVKIGEGCKIRRVEYSGTLDVHPESEVEEAIKI